MSEPLWTSTEITLATGGRHTGATFEAYEVCIDTRTIKPGDLFVALAGERNGSVFAAEALSKGAAGVLTTQPQDGPAVVVGDSLKALEALGVMARTRAATAKRAAVTGSVGKTSVTQAIAAALKVAGASHSSVLSYNNHIGVPLTLARMPKATERAVFEIGMNHAGEITPLSRMVSPQVAVVTTVGPVHVENFPDGEIGVARAKAEIFDGLETGGTAVLNADDRWFDLLSQSARAVGAKVLSFGSAEGCDARLVDFEAGFGAVVTASLHGQALRFPIAQSGAHWGLNSMATLLAVGALGAPVETAIEALAGFAPLGGRGAETQVAIEGGFVTLIDESYNANPVSMGAALRTLGAHKTEGRRIAALTDMLELGPDSPAVHAALVEPIEAARVDLVFAAGPLMRSLHDALPGARRGGYAETADALALRLFESLQPGDVVMVKGSKGSRASQLVAALVAEQPGGRA